MFKKIRYWFWFISTFVKKNRLLLLFSLAVGISSIIWGRQLIYVLPLNNNETIGLVARPTIEELPSLVTNKITSSLFIIDSDGSPVPQIVDKWELEDDDKAYHLWLRQDLVWQDGTQFKAKDIILNIPDLNQEIINKHEIIFRLPQKYSPFLTALTQPLFKKDLIGLGEYEVIADKKHQGRYTKLTLQSPTRRLIYKFYPSQNELETAFKLGHIDRAEDLISTPTVTGWRRVVIETEINYQRYVAIFFNTRQGMFQEKNIRQALTYSFDKPTDQTRTLSSINPQSWAYNPQVKQYTTNFESAEKLLSSLDDFYPQDQLITISTYLPYLDLADNISSAWRELGFETKVELVSNIPDNFDVLLTGRDIPPDPDQYTLWHSTQVDSGNITGYSNPQIDKLLEDSRRESDQTKRQEIYRDFQRFLLEDCPVAFISFLPTYSLSRPPIF